MSRYLEFAITIVEMAGIPIAGCSIGFTADVTLPKTPSVIL